MGNNAKAIFIILLVALALFIAMAVSFNWESGGGTFGDMQPMGVVVLGFVVEWFM